MTEQPTNSENRQRPENRPRRIIARFSEADFQSYLKRAQDLGTTRSRLIRHLVREFLGTGPR